MLSGSARRDASNLFGLNTNDKWNLLWSVGASWEISREPFYRLNSVPYLRLRSTYGFSGNIDPSMSALTTIRYVAVSPNTPGAPYARDRQSVVKGKSVSVRVDLGVRRIIKKKINNTNQMKE